MKPTPAIPEEARKHFVMAQTLQEKAKDTGGFELAISEYKEVLLIAPWWPEAYNNMGVLLEQVGQYDEAMRTFKLYVLTNPKDAREAQDKIYAIEAANKLAQAEERESSPEAIAAKKRKEDEEWLKKLDGARFVSREAYTYKVTNDPRHGYNDTFYSAMEIRGNEVRWGQIWTTTGEWEYDGEHESIEGRGFTLRGIRWRSGGIKVDEIAIISDDGNTITYEADNGQHILYRQPKRR
jgi:tetratricopeptide (TPR) repeat protein